ncbi:Cupin-2 domain-containing protein [Mycena sanguinolenta]|uniref:Cupin-2 domain-containing protein n=1 Tax=Mycena sanguinolenta TaxID=230812 RepID=A0A8H6Z3K9_9AGAR|nr:Cupin-2 domain-containing protein [Mycena sanguinolenta]
MGDPRALTADSWSIGKGITMSVLHNPLRTHVHVTGEEPLSVPPHWHLSHEEQHVVLKGRIRITQDGVARVVGPADGKILTRPGVVHSIESFAGEETIIEETAGPGEDINAQKVIFFRNMFAPGVLQSFLSTMQIFYYGDGYPALPLGIRRFEWLLVVVMGGWVAGLLGYQIPDKRLRLDQRRFPPKKQD